jgi:hypothetical protein
MSEYGPKSIVNPPAHPSSTLFSKIHTSSFIVHPYKERSSVPQRTQRAQRIQIHVSLSAIFAFSAVKKILFQINNPKLVPAKPCGDGSTIINRQSSFVNPPAPPTPHCPRKLPAVPLQSMPLPNRVRWTRDQLLIVLNLYHKLRFGQFDSRQRVIIDLAARLGRTR